MVKIISNYQPCYEITIYRKTILLCSNILIKYWKPLLLHEQNDESRIAQYEQISENWDLIEPFAKLIVKRLNGCQLLFLSDDYENILDKCYEGEIELHNMIELLTKDYSSTEINCGFKSGN